MPLTDNLIAHWKLNEASGTRNDSHGTNHLTDNNTVTSAAGKIGNAGDFEFANNEYLSINDNTDLSLSSDQDFTFACWFNPESFGGNARALAGKLTSTSAAGSCEWFVDLVSASEVRLRVSDGTTIGNLAVTGLSLSAGTWYFLVVWHDSTANKLRLQIDGGTVNELNWTTGTRDGTAPLAIGRWGSVVGFSFDGLIDSSSFWKRVLTDTERSDLYNGGAGLDYENFAGGTTHTGSVGETLTAADSQTAVATFVSSRSESVTAADSSIGLPAFTVSLSESLSASDAITSTATFGGTQNETLAGNDSISAVATFTSARAESATLGDTCDGATGTLHTASVSESVTVTESCNWFSTVNLYAYATERASSAPLSSRSTATPV
jgi:hypothetical protein